MSSPSGHSSNNISLDFDKSDANACIAFISGLPLTNARLAQPSLAALLTALEATPLQGAAYLDVLEAARVPVHFVQDDLALRYAAKPLPPTASEEETFLQVLQLWQAMERAYAKVATLGAEDPLVQLRMALICQRCVYYAGRVLIEYLRARREPAPGAWLDLHGYYDTADEWHLADELVQDPLNETQGKASASEAYAAVLLIDLSNPYSRGSREFGWIVRWAERFAPFAKVELNVGVDTARAFGVDLMQDQGVRPLDILTTRSTVRHFDTARLNPDMHQLLAQLRENVSPASLGLGANLEREPAARLLVQLYRPWCLHAVPRRFQRRDTTGVAQLCLGFEAMHYHVNGDEFLQPEHVRIYSRGDMDRIWTFRDQLDPTQPLKIRESQINYPLEEWAMADQSVSGFRLQRRTAGERIEHSQLIALKPNDGGQFLLAQVSWYLMRNASIEINIGVYVLPGVPQGVAIRATGPMVSPSEQYIRAFLLPDLPALKEQGSLLLPRGWYQPKRIIEVFTDRQITVELGDLLTQGADFERVSYRPMTTAAR